MRCNVVKGIGVDIIEIERMKKALWRRPVLEKRLFTLAELTYCRQKANPYPSLAARFAAKEAVLKALGTGLRGMSWQDIEIEVNALGGPEVILRGKAALKAKSLGINKILLSLSHSKDYAVAYALAM